MGRLIAIKDFEIPKNCGDCYLTSIKSVSNPWDMICSCNLKDIDINEQTRAEHCPLVEVKDGMTIKESISIFEAKGKYSLTEKENEAKEVAIETMRKYQKIEDIYYHQSGQALENSLRAVIEDGEID